jgi:hypothetical protein
MSKLDAFLSDVEKRWEGKKKWCESYCYSAIRHVDRNCEIECDHSEGRDGLTLDDCPGGFGRYDGPSIAHAPQDVAGLVAVVRAVRAMLETVNDPRKQAWFDGQDCLRGLILKAMESAVPGSESQNDDEARSSPSKETAKSAVPGVKP